MIDGEKNAVNAMARAGMTLNTDYTFDYALPYYGIPKADEYSRIKAWRELNNELPAEAANGLPILSTLGYSSASWSHKQKDGRIEEGGWISWNVMAPTSGMYAFKIDAESGGDIDVKVNEAAVIYQGPTGRDIIAKEQIFLTKGLHNIRARARSGAFALYGISSALPGQPYGPAGVIGQSAYRSVLLRWPEVAGASGYNIYYKTRTETDYKPFNAKPLTFADTLHRLQGLEPDVTHNFVVTSLKNGQESAFSNEVTLVPLTELPIIAWRFNNENERAVSQSTEQDLIIKPSQIQMVGLKAMKNGHFTKRGMGIAGHPHEGQYVAQPNEEQYYQFTVTPAEKALMKLQASGVWRI